MNTRFACIVFLAACGSSGVLPLSASGEVTWKEPGPSDSIRRTMDDLLRILTDETLRVPGRTATRRQALEDLLRERVSYDEMAKRALGSQWTTLNERERSEFVNLFVELLRDSFANHVTDLVEDRVIYLGEQHYDPSFAEVHTQLMGPKLDTTVDFRMIRQGHSWLVYDVVVEGTSLVYNYRAQFSRVIKEVSYPMLVRQLKERTLTLKRFETASPR